MKLLAISLLLLIQVSCQTSRPTIIAHRGLPRLLPEHTLEGVEAAMAYDIDFVEPDVVLTKDLVPIVLHDTHLDTTTNVAKLYPTRKRIDGRYYAIDFRLNEIKKLSINHRINLKTGQSAFKTRPLIKNGKYTIPTLKEFIHLVLSQNKVHGKNIGIYPELKAPTFHLNHKSDITKITHDLLLEYEGVLEVIIQCFEDGPLRRLKKLGSPFKRVQLIGSNSWKINSVDYTKMLTSSGLKEVSTYADGIGPWIPLLFNENFKPNQITSMAQGHGLIVHPYTLRNDSLYKGVSSEKHLIDLLFNKAHIDGIFTDNVNTTTILLRD